MTKKKGSFKALIFFPIILLLAARLGIEIFARILPAETAWIPSFIFYYILIVVLITFSIKILKIDYKQLSFNIRPFPDWKSLIFLVLLPGILPLAVFILHFNQVSITYLIFICIFAFINPVFEETFWRGLMYFMPGKKITTVLYSALMFSFSHYFLWGSYWFRNPYVLIPTVVSTFIMGLLWMWFVQRQKNIIYPILSHLLVDFFNLSVAAYSGIIFKIN